MFGVSTFESEKHTEIPGELRDFVSRMIAESSGGTRWLTVIRYNQYGTFVIAEWMSPNKDVFVDVMNLDHSLANFTYEKAQELRQRLFAPTTGAEVARTSAEAESDFHHDLQDWNDEMVANDAYDRKHGM